DDEDDYFLVSRLLAEVSAQYKVTWIHNYEDGLKELEKGTYDVCLLDYHLGTETGLEILSKVEESPATPPIIILTGHGDYLIDLKAMKYGAADYLVKDQMSGLLLERAIRYSMDRKKSKDDLRESERQLKYLSSALLRVQENERRMVAAELHDDLGQLLTAIKYKIESVLMRMDPDESRTLDLNAIIPNVQLAIEQVRNMYTQLMPTVLDDLGIAATLSWFCREFQKDHPNILVESQFKVREEEITADLRLVIFRIVQNAFDSVTAHSKAGRTRVSLVGEDGYVRLDIGDNGAAFDVAHAVSFTCPDCSLGLISMKRRAELSGGSFEIGSAEGGGTFVRVQWAIADQ
ncbi:MAG TPA: response regulator, partial [Deltaproteobacteria bacterium]|nr:response regulator [Deltaproteobacteria bacterium]